MISKKQIFIFISLFATSIATTQNQNTCQNKYDKKNLQFNPSLKIQLGLDFLDVLKNDYIDNILSYTINTPSPQHFGYGYMEYMEQLFSLDDFIYTFQNVERAESSLTLNKTDENGIQYYNIYLQNLQIQGKGHVTFDQWFLYQKMSGELFYLSDNLTIQSPKISLNILFYFSMKDCQLSIEVDYIKVDHFSFPSGKISATWWLYKKIESVSSRLLINYLKDLYKKLIENDLKEPLQNTFKQFFQRQIIDLDSQDIIKFDNRFFTTPELNNKSFIINNLFMIYPKSISYMLPQEDNDILPNFKPQVFKPEINNQINLMISQYYFKSYFYSLFKNNQLNFNITNKEIGELSTKTLKPIFPSLIFKYGQYKPIEISIQAKEYPNIKITKREGITANMVTQIDFSFGLNENDSFLKIECDLHFIVKVTSSQNYLNFSLLTANFKSFKNSSGEFHPGFLFQISGAKHLNKILNQSLPFINQKFFSKGLNLQQVTSPYYSIINPYIQYMDGFLFVEADFSKKLTL